MTEREEDSRKQDYVEHIEPPPLSRRIVYGSLWVFALRIASRLLQLVSLLILARLLMPEDFGLMGIVLVTIATLETFSQTGFQAALIQKKDDIREYADTAWTVHVIRGLLLCSILVLLAPLIAGFFNEERVTPLLRVVALGLVLRGLTNIHVLYFQKELQFSKEFAFQISGTIVNVAVAIPLAIIYRSVWALVAGHLAGHFARLVVSYLLIPAVPHLRLEWAKFKEMFAFGKWVLGSGVLVFFATQGDDIFVGKFLGAVALGFYQLAYRISNTPATEITHVISQVTFPAYSKMQDNIPRLREAYLKVFQLTTLLSFPVAGMILVLGKDFTRLFLGEKWLPMVPAMQILVILGAVRSIAATAGPVFYAVGKPKIDTLWQIVRVTTLFVLLYPLTTQWGILGASIAATLSMLISGSGFLLSAIKTTSLEFGGVVKILIFPSTGTVILIVSILALKVCSNIANISTFLLIAVAGMLAYTGVIWLSDKFMEYGALRLLKEQLAAFRKM